MAVCNVCFICVQTTAWLWDSDHMCQTGDKDSRPPTCKTSTRLYCLCSVFATFRRCGQGHVSLKTSPLVSCQLAGKQLAATSSVKGTSGRGTWSHSTLTLSPCKWPFPLDQHLMSWQETPREAVADRQASTAVRDSHRPGCMDRGHLCSRDCCPSGRLYRTSKAVPEEQMAKTTNQCLPLFILQLLIHAGPHLFVLNNLVSFWEKIMNPWFDN